MINNGREVCILEYRKYYFGISFIGIIAFVIQEIPYIIMPLIKPTSNPIMNMQNEILWIEKVQGMVGMILINFVGWTFYYLVWPHYFS